VTIRFVTTLYYKWSIVAMRLSCLLNVFYVYDSHLYICADKCMTQNLFSRYKYMYRLAVGFLANYIHCRFRNDPSRPSKIEDFHVIWRAYAKTFQEQKKQQKIVLIKGTQVLRSALLLLCLLSKKFSSLPRRVQSDSLWQVASNRQGGEGGRSTVMSSACRRW